MKTVWLIILLIYSAPLRAQKYILRGGVSIQNSEYETGKRKYVSNAAVADDSSKAQPTATDGGGQFQLAYIGIGDGYSVSFHVTRPGLEVVNFPQLSAVIGQYDKVEIVMATKGQVAEYRKRFFNIGITAAEKRLALLVSQKNARIAILNKDKMQNAAIIDSLHQQLADLEIQKGKILQQSKELADIYAVKNLDDAPALFKAAFRLFQRGQLDSALLILPENSVLKKRVDSNLAQGRLLNEIGSIYRHDKNDLAQLLRLKGDLYKTLFQFDNVRWCYATLVRLDSTDFSANYGYGNFLQFINKNEEARPYLSRSIELLALPENVNRKDHKANLASACRALGLIYWGMSDYKAGDSLLGMALSLYRELVKEDPLTFGQDLAWTLNDQGLLYKNEYAFEKAALSFSEALLLFRQQDSSNISNYKYTLASTLNNIGNMLDDQSDFNKAETCYLQSLALFEQLDRLAPGKYEPGMATLENDLGSHYIARNEFTKAKAILLNALEIRKRLVKRSWQLYAPSLGTVEITLGNVYNAESDFLHAKMTYEEGLEIFQQLAVSDALTYLPLLAVAKDDLAVLYDDHGDTEEALLFYNGALSIYRTTAKENPTVYGPEIAKTQNNLGGLYIDSDSLENASLSLNESLNIYRRLIRSGGVTFEPSLMTVLNNMGRLYSKRNELKQAEAAFKECLDLAKKWAMLDPKTFGSNVGRTLEHLGDLYIQMNDFHQAELLYKEGAELFKERADSNFLAFGPYLADIQASLGSLYESRLEYQLAEVWYLKAKQVDSQLTARNPEAFELELGRVHNMLGELYKRTNELILAEMAFREAVRCIESVVRLHPSNKMNRRDGAATLMNLGIIYTAERDSLKAEAALLDGTGKLRQLTKEDSSRFVSDLANCLDVLGTLYQKYNNFPKAKWLFLESLSLYQRPYATDTVSHDQNYGSLLNDLLTNSMAQKDYRLADTVLRQGLQLTKKIATNDPAYEQKYASMLYNAGDLYIKDGKYLLSESALQESLAIEERSFVSDSAGALSKWKTIATKLAELYAMALDSTPRLAAKVHFQENAVILIGKLSKMLGESKETRAAYALNYGNLAWYQLFAGQYIAAEASARQGIRIDSSQRWIETNLAHALLFQGRYAEALALYQELALAKNPAGKPYPDVFLEDLDELETQGVTHPDVRKIREYLKKMATK